MSITDPWIVEPYESRGTFILQRGRESYYAGDRLLEWDTEAEAEAYRDTLPAPKQAAGQLTLFDLGAE